MKNSMHLDSGKHPFQFSKGAGKTLHTAMGKSNAAHKTAKGVTPAGASSNAEMRVKPPVSK